MKDAYSFDVDKESSLKNFLVMKKIYISIFKRLGVIFTSVSADSGGIGGESSEEFHALAQSGEDELMVSDKGDFAANIEICPTQPGKLKDIAIDLKNKQEFSTPNIKTIKDLSQSEKIDQKDLVKILFLSVSDTGFKPIAILLRGNEEVNLIKVKNYFNLSFEPKLLINKDIKNITKASVGSCGPIGLDIPVYLDHGLIGHANYIVGANKDGFHIRNVNHIDNKDFSPTAIADFRKAKTGDLSLVGGGVLKSVRGIEIGHIFYLGTLYSEDMNLYYLNKKGQKKPVEMGCYGLGVSRTLQAIVEQNNDKDGIVWPVSVAPFHVHICHLDINNTKTEELVSQLEAKFKKQNLEVFVDDRDERPGVKFKDADLLGIPVRLNIGTRGLKSEKIEVVDRKTKTIYNVETKDIIDKVLNILNL